jgi:hypothetical protein
MKHPENKGLDFSLGTPFVLSQKFGTIALEMLVSLRPVSGWLRMGLTFWFTFSLKLKQKN